MKKTKIYSQFVSLTKKLCIVLAIIFALSLVTPFLNLSNKKLSLKLKTVDDLPLDDKSSIINPNFHTVDKNENKYQLLANNALEQTKNKFLLDAPKANIYLNDNKTLEMLSKKGTWHQLGKLLEINDGVKIIYDNAYEANTVGIILDIANNLIIGYNPIAISGALGTLNASGLKASIKNKTIYFSGPIKIIIKKSKND